MNDINILEELGLEEVSRKTHIETKTLEHMVNKEFSKLSRINTLGFIKILRREYNLDLQNWVDEFEEYLQSKQLEDMSNASVLQQNIEPEKSRAWVYFLLLFLILLGVGFWRFDGMGYFGQLKERFFEKNTSTFTQAPVVQEAKEKLDTLEESTMAQPAQSSSGENEENTTQEAEQEDMSLVSSTSPSIVPQSIEEKLAAKDNEEENLSSQEVANVEIVNIETIQSKDSSIKENQDELDQEKIKQEKIKQEEKKQDELKQEEEKHAKKELFIKPNKKIWVGAVNLANKKRSTWLSVEPIEIDIQSPQLLIVGHGDFIFDLGDDKTQTPTNKQKAYYHIENGEIKHISQNEFIRKNGGKNW